MNQTSGSNRTTSMARAFSPKPPQHPTSFQRGKSMAGASAQNLPPSKLQHHQQHCVLLLLPFGTPDSPFAAAACPKRRSNIPSITHSHRSIAAKEPLACRETQNSAQNSDMFCAEKSPMSNPSTTATPSAHQISLDKQTLCNSFPHNAGTWPT